MLKIEMNAQDSVAILEPDGAITEQDVKLVTRVIDNYIEQSGNLAGIVIYTQTFPGWASFAALLQHLSFIKDHHKQVARVALVTDSHIGDFAEHVANHFVQAAVKSFNYDHFLQARLWAKYAADVKPVYTLT